MSDQIDVNEIANTLQTKMDLDMGNLQQNVDIVVEYQVPTASNNQTWYRLYRSGWIEQGGVVTSTASNITINLPKTMSDTKYTILLSNMDLDWNAYNTTSAYFTKTNSNFQTNCSLGGTYYASEISWEVKGMSAQS